MAILSHLWRNALLCLPKFFINQIKISLHLCNKFIKFPINSVERSARIVVAQLVPRIILGMGSANKNDPCGTGVPPSMSEIGLVRKVDISGAKRYKRVVKLWEFEPEMDRCLLPVLQRDCIRCCIDQALCILINW